MKNCRIHKDVDKCECRCPVVILNEYKITGLIIHHYVGNAETDEDYEKIMAIIRETDEILLKIKTS